MGVAHDMSLLSLIAQAILPVQLVMAILVLVSIFSWTLIFRKWFFLHATKKQTEAFERDFWSGGDLGQLYQRASNRKDRAGSLERIFEAGMREFLKVRQSKGADSSMMLDGARRAMLAASQREMDVIESHLPFLASTGSVSPYIGLFGTVWGIMQAFRGLANVQQATLASVAPGIAEALVATAVGLFAAIPAVLAYNRFATQVDHIAIRFDSFVEEFSNILARQAR